MARSTFALGFLLLSGCATVPEGPSSVALPGTGKSVEEFRAADAACRQHALDAAAGKGAGDAQHRYDSAYVQCMYAAGHRVPISGRMIAPDADPATPPRDSQYAPPPDFYPIPPAPSYR